MTELKKYQEGNIHKKLMNGCILDEVLVSYKMQFNIPAKKAAKLLIQRLTEFMADCDKYGIE
jgi:hypothetical protein